VATAAQGQGVAHRIADRPGRLGEDRPPGAGIGEGDVDDRPAAGEAVQAGALLALQLEQFEQPGGLVGVGDHVQVPALVVEHQAGRVGADEFDAALRQHLQVVDDVERIAQGVGQLDEDLRQALRANHGPSCRR
jgi:hypothetical protein